MTPIVLPKHNNESVLMVFIFFSFTLTEFMHLGRIKYYIKHALGCGILLLLRCIPLPFDARQILQDLLN